MLKFEECKKILQRNGKKYTDEEIEKIKDFLWEIAQIEIKNIEKLERYENSSINEQG